jgi:hypothetical protein
VLSTSSKAGILYEYRTPLRDRMIEDMKRAEAIRGAIHRVN